MGGKCWEAMVLGGLWDKADVKVTGKSYGGRQMRKRGERLVVLRQKGR